MEGWGGNSPPPLSYVFLTRTCRQENSILNSIHIKKKFPPSLLSEEALINHKEDIKGSHKKLFFNGQTTKAFRPPSPLD